MTSRLPPPPVVAAALSGFVIGVFATLIAAGIALHDAAPKTPAPTPVPTTQVAANSTMKARIQQLANLALGPSPGQSKTRVLSVKVTTVVRPGRVHGLPTCPDCRHVVITFQLNRHPLGKTWQLKAAKGDTFDLMKALYTSRLPVYDVWLKGEFPLADPYGNVKLRKAIEAYMDFQQAHAIPWKQWGRANENKLWDDLSYRWVDPRFG